MTTSAFPQLSKLKPVSVNVSDATLRDFSGGLRSVESDVTLKSKFSVVLDNLLSNDDQSHVLRFGTNRLASTTANILDLQYYTGVLIATLADGTIEAINPVGVVAPIWNSTIAAALPGSPAGWGATANHVDVTEKGGELVITNNVDKPVLIKSSLVVDYLQDLATLTNINTPIGRHITTVGNYVVIAFEGVNPEIIISSSGTSGTWIGDPAPNDSVRFNLGGYISKESGSIIALSAFKNSLVVFFKKAIVVVALGEYDTGGIHKPRVIDTIVNIGCISHRTIIVREEDFIFLSSDGIYSVNKNTLTGAFKSRLLSDAIAPLIYRNLPKVGSEAGYSFAVEDRSKKKIFFFIKKEDNTKFILCLSFKQASVDVTWSVISGWDFDGGCATELKRVFFFKDNHIYQYGNDIFTGEDYYADLISASNPLGDEIAFDWETAWLDLNERVKTKRMLKMTADTLGSATFYLSLFVDKLYKDVDGNYTPALTMEMRGGSVTGYGTPSIGYGGGRRISEERTYGFPVDFKLLKFRISGAARERLVLTALSMIYRMGSYKR